MVGRWRDRRLASGPGRQGRRLWPHRRIITGVLGAIVGGWLAGAVFGGDYLTGINVPTIFVAFVGALILIAIERAIFGGRARL